MLANTVSYGSHHEKTCLWSCLNQPAQLQRLVRILKLNMCQVYLLTTKGPDQSAHILRLVSAFVVCMQNFLGFLKMRENLSLEFGNNKGAD